MISMLGQVMLYVWDVERMKAFWTEEVGFVVVSEVHEEGINFYELAPSEHSQTTVVLQDRKAIEATEPELNFETPSLMFYTEDAGRLYQKLQEAGVTVGEMVEMAGTLVFNFADPEGNYFAVMETSRRHH